VYVALLILLAMTVGAAFIPSSRHPMGRDLLTATGFLIAGAKALLIILWFMHAKASSRVTWIFASAGFAFLIIMFALTLNDYLSRQEVPVMSTNAPPIVESRAGDQ
jgi:cytochrome c oxidase subunit 4